MTEETAHRDFTCSRVSAAALALLMLVFSSACFLAPAPIEGASEGSSCAADLACASGLICGCGTCVPNTPSVPRNPPSCDVNVDNRCPSTPSGCYESCGVEVVVGIADCVAGRESCDANGGVLFDECPLETCWGEPEPGEVCVDGAFECAYGRNGPTGLCYTFDCVDEPEQCVIDCQSDVRTTQVCVADEWKCESGFPARQCGGCVGTPPPCVESCAEPFRTGTATCIEDEWSCTATASLLESACCLQLPAENVQAPEDLEALLDETCLLGQLNIIETDLLIDVDLPNLRRVEKLFLVNTSAGSLLLPTLKEIDQDFIAANNPELAMLDMNALAFVGGDFLFSDVPALDACMLEDLVATVVSREGIDGEILLPTTDAGCPEPDAGFDDAGALDAGGADAGALDAGATDAGALDAGPDDAGALDAGSQDAGASDGGAADGG